MALTTVQIIDMLYLKGVGPKTVLKVGDSLPDYVSDDDLKDYLTKFKMRAKFYPNEWDWAIKRAREAVKEELENGINIISFYDEIFPNALRNAVDASGKDDPCLVLYCLGDLSLLKEDIVAVVGGYCSDDSKELRVAKRLGANLSARGAVVVSSIDIGISTAIHAGALSAKNGKSIAILDCGLGKVLPPEFPNVGNHILRCGGLLLSEYQTCDLYGQYYDVKRDRLIAALSKATVVVSSSSYDSAKRIALCAHHRGKSLYSLCYAKNSFSNNQEFIKNNGAQALYYDVEPKFQEGLDQLVVSLYKCT